MKRLPELSLYRTCAVVGETTYVSGGERTLTQALAEAVAKAEGVDPTELPPLYESIDLDALTQLMTKPSEDAGDEILVSLQMNDWNMFVSSDGHIRVCDATDETSSPEPIFEENMS